MVAAQKMSANAQTAYAVFRAHANARRRLVALVKSANAASHHALAVNADKILKVPGTFDTKIC